MFLLTAILWLLLQLKWFNIHLLLHGMLGEDGFSTTWHMAPPEECVERGTALSGGKAIIFYYGCSTHVTF